LLQLLSRAASGRGEFSSTERALYVAGEFWAAVNGSELEAHFDAQAASALADARRAFSIVGALEVAEILSRFAARADKGCGLALAALEEELLSATESVDRLIADFAGRYLCAELGLDCGSSAAHGCFEPARA
jgi:hypothetical protein